MSKKFIVHEKYTNKYDVAHNIMLVILPKPFKEVTKYARLYGCTDLFKGENKRTSKGLLLKSLGCGLTQRTEKNRTANGELYTTKYRQSIIVRGLYGENVGCSVSSDGYIIYLFTISMYCTIIFLNGIDNFLKIAFR